MVAQLPSRPVRRCVGAGRVARDDGTSGDRSRRPGNGRPAPRHLPRPIPEGRGASRARRTRTASSSPSWCGADPADHCRGRHWWASSSRTGSALRHGDAGVPSRGSTSARRLIPDGIEPGTDHEPGRDGVGVPHLVSAELVATPHWRGDERDQIEELACLRVAVDESYRTRNGVPEVGDHTVAPSADLVAEDAEPSAPRSFRPCPSATTPRS